MLNEKKSDRVAIIYGRFQPLSKAHYNMIKNAISMYEEVYILPVQGPKAFVSDRKTTKGKETDMQRKYARNPFPIGLRVEMILKSFPQLDSKNVLRSKKGSIEYVYDLLNRMYPKKDFSGLDVWAGEDEFDDYSRQVVAMRNKDEYKDVSIIVHKYDEGTRHRTELGDIKSTVSGSKIRDFIAHEDKPYAFENYAELVAPPLANKEWFTKLRKHLKKVRRLDIEEGMYSFLNRLDEETVDMVAMLRKQGYSKNKDDKNYIAIELEIGTEVELEHIKDEKAAKEIAKDHLEENPFYYTKTLAMVEPGVRKIAKRIIISYGYKNCKEYWSDYGSY